MNRLLTLEEVTDVLQIPKSWVYGRVHAGNLPFEYVKIGHYFRFPHEGIKKYIEENLRNPTLHHTSAKELGTSEKKRGSDR